MKLKVLFAARKLFNVPYESYFFTKLTLQLKALSFTYLYRKLFEHSHRKL